MKKNIWEDSMMYSDVLTESMDVELKDLCVSIDLGEVVYPLSFIRWETNNYLVIDSTGDDGCERLVVLNKEKILSVNVVYQQDMFKEKKDDKMFR